MGLEQVGSEEEVEGRHSKEDDEPDERKDEDGDGEIRMMRGEERAEKRRQRHPCL